MPLSPGSRLGRYTVQAPLGAGGMGEVFLAFDPLLERNVALKVLPVDIADATHKIERFVREAKAASALNHPNILTVHDFGSHEQMRFLVTEYIDGRTFREWAAEERPSVLDVLDATAQAASALAAAHAAGIVHRDVKPENLMLRRDGFVKVLDFGIAKLLAETVRGVEQGGSTGPQFQTQPGTILGTTRYMSPEQALETAVDARSDVWSLGVVLYELLTGRPPFDGQTPMGTLAMIIGREPKSLETLAPETPASVSAIVERALRKKPEERYETAAGMAAELARALQELRTGPARNATQDAIATRALTPAREEARVLTNLPPPASELIGRGRELGEVTAMLRAEGLRLLTLTGPGGTGKTRLAVEAGRELVGEFADGVFAVDLSTLSDPELLASHVAQVLGVKESGGVSLADGLGRYLSERRLLLVLDNFEHLLAGAPLVSRLLAAAPGLTVLVTSRALLHLSAEREYAVEPLAVPAFSSLPPLDELAQAPAVALFVERAREAKPSFALTAENARAVVEVCRRLDGLPLAIELAAARVKMLAPQAMLERLEHRLKLLTGGARDLPSRQQTMRGAISWSYELLDEAEKRLLRRLSVFAGGCTLGAAEAVCDVDGDLGTDVLDGLASLADKSLVTQLEQGDDEPRFRMLELVREFAWEQLGDRGGANLVAARFVDYFLAMVEAAKVHTGMPYAGGWTELFVREHDNLRAALAHAVATSPEHALRLAGGLYVFWRARGYLLEGRMWCERALGSAGDAAPTAAKAKALLGAGELVWRLGDIEAASAFYQESLRMGLEIDDKPLIGDASSGLGVVELLRGNLAEGRSLFEKALGIARELGYRSLAGKVLNNLGEIARGNGDLEGARALYEESLAETGASDPPLSSVVCFNIGETLLNGGDLQVARGYFHKSLAIGRESSFMIGILAALEGFSNLAAAEGHMRRAALLFGATDALGEELGILIAETNDEKVREPLWAAARAELGAEAFDAALLEGRALGLDEALALAERDPAGE